MDCAFYRSSPSLTLQGWKDGLKSLPPDSLTLSSERARLWDTLPYCWALGRLSGPGEAAAVLQINLCASEYVNVATFA